MYFEHSFVVVAHGSSKLFNKCLREFRRGGDELKDKLFELVVCFGRDWGKR